MSLRVAATRPPLVLAYHALGSHDAALDPHNLMVEPARFREQMRILARRGYRFVALREFARRLSAAESLAGICALTFDDGTLDNLQVLAPILAELSLPATVFVCPGLLGDPHFAMPAQSGVRLMDAGELRELARSPLIEIGSHTDRHRNLSRASAEDATAEMARSKQALEDLLRQPIVAFAYPECGYSPACPDAARGAGYEVAVTCGGRGGLERFALARESVDSLDRRLSFELKSRRLFWPLRRSRLGRLARVASNPIRHRGGSR